jgi:hypothetical protein
MRRGGVAVQEKEGIVALKKAQRNRENNVAFFPFSLRSLREKKPSVTSQNQTRRSPPRSLRYRSFLAT